jgi:hypothetical protein
MKLSFINGFLTQQYDEGVPVKTAAENLIFAVGQKMVEGENFQRGFRRGIEEAPAEIREKLASLMEPGVVVPVALQKAASADTAMGQLIRNLQKDTENA